MAEDNEKFDFDMAAVLKMAQDGADSVEDGAPAAPSESPPAADEARSASPAKESPPQDKTVTMAEQLQEERAHRIAMQQQLATMMQTMASQQGQQNKEPPPADPLQSLLSGKIGEEEEKIVLAIHGDYGDQIASMARQAIISKQAIPLLVEVIGQLRQEVAQQRDGSKDHEQYAAEQAINANPYLTGLRGTSAGEWGMVQELHSTLMRTNRGYAASGWQERMPVLERMHRSMSWQPAPAATPAAKSGIPATMSNVPGGGGGGTAPKGVEDMGTGEMMEMFRKAAVSGKITDILAVLAAGGSGR